MVEKQGRENAPAFFMKGGVAVHQVELTPRLQAVARLIPRGSRLADIGTDHGYLPVWLIQNRIIPSAIAADLRPGPLARARETVDRFGLAGSIALRLCNGLSGIRSEEVDAVAIAGMGGETISQILSAAPWLKENHIKLVLQPMSTQRELRIWLCENGFRIEYETIAAEDDVFYHVMSVEAGEMSPLSPGQEWAGLQDPRNAMLGAYLDREIGRVRRILDGLSHAKDADSVLVHKSRLEAVLLELNKMREEWGH